MAPSPLGPFSVLRRQSCNQPQKPFRLRRCGRKRCGRGRGCTCQSGRRVLCVRLDHGGLGNTGLRCPEEVRENVQKPALGDSTPASETPRTLDPGPRAQGPGHAQHPHTGKPGGQGGPAHARPPAPSSLAAPLQLKSRVRKERGVRTVAPAARTKPRALCKGRSKTTRKTCQRSPQGHKAQKKKAEGIGRTVKSPDENRFPDRYDPRIAYIVK